jgi:hypothetical protein
MRVFTVPLKPIFGLKGFSADCANEFSWFESTEGLFWWCWDFGQILVSCGKLFAIWGLTFTHKTNLN